MVTVSDVTRAFGARVLVENASFFLDTQSRMGLVGANGAGKTSLLRVLAQIDLPDGGSVNIAKDVSIGLLIQRDDAPGQDRDDNQTVWQSAFAAFARVQQIESRMRELEAQMQAERDEDRLNALVEQHAAALARFESLGGYEMDSRCSGALIGLGLPRECWEQPIGTLSGGQRRRLALAKLLLERPTVLLLDEPTNHLDLSAMQYLEGVLRGWQGPVVCVSHDRWFMDAVCTQIAELAFTKLTIYRGNYTQYLAQSAERFEQLKRSYRLQQREIARQEAIIARYRMFNREKSIRAARSRQKMLDRVERIEAPRAANELTLAFPAPPHLGFDALGAVGISKQFDGKLVVPTVDVAIKQGDRVAVVGPNGCGKTTLLRMLCSKLEPDAGHIVPGAGLRIGWFDQHQRTLGAAGTVLEELRDAFPLLGDQRLRTLLAAFLFPGEDVFAEMAVLSGGERARLMLLKLLLTAPNLLALDEPTNHLDMPARVALEEALLAWPGTLLFVSHDRFFVERVATRVWVFEDGELYQSEGGWQEYLEERAQRLAPPVEAVNQTQKRRELRAEREQTRERQARARQIAELETQIAELETAKAQMEEAMADPALYADEGRARQSVLDYNEMTQRLERLFEQWAQLAE